MRDSEKSDALIKNGIVQLDEAEAEMIRDVKLYFDAGGRWFGPNAEGFSVFKDSEAATYLTYYGFSKSDKQSNIYGQKPVDRALLFLKQRHKVAYAGPLAGYPVGLHQCGADKILVTEPTKIIQPAKGECNKIRELIESMLLDESQRKPNQSTVFYTLLSARYNTLLERISDPSAATFRFCPALAMVGPKGCGKSALIDLVLKPLFGGRTADPTTFLNEPKFNKDLFIAPLLVMDDKGSKPNLAMRRERGENLKDLIWKPEQRMEGKGQDAIPLTPFRWLIMASNFDDAAMQIHPTMTDALSDKIVHLLCQQAEWLPGTHAENEKWVKELRAELPAFAHFIKNFKPPKNAELNSRSRVIIFHHPAIVEKLRGMQPEMKLLHLIDHYKVWNTATDFWEGNATEFNEKMLERDSENRVYAGMFSTLNAVGRALTELSNVTPERVICTNRGNVSHYKIKPPQEQ